MVKTCLDETRAMQLSYERVLELKALDVLNEKTMKDLEKEPFSCQWNNTQIVFSTSFENLGKPQRDGYGFVIHRTPKVLGVVSINGEDKVPFPIYLEQAAQCLNSADRCIIETAKLTIQKETYEQCIDQGWLEASSPDIICKSKRLYHLPKKNGEEERKRP